jgi:hypothetical protein
MDLTEEGHARRRLFMNLTDRQYVRWVAAMRARIERKRAARARMAVRTAMPWAPPPPGEERNPA